MKQPRTRESGRTGGFRLSPNEVARLVKEEREKRRKLRIVQVREQAKLNAAKVRQAVQREKEKQIKKLAQDIQRDWEANQEEKLCHAQDLYDRSVQQVGQAHSEAVTQEDDPIARQLLAERNQQVADDRERVALKQLRHQQQEEAMEATKHIRARELALEGERKRAAHIAALPLPPPKPKDDSNQSSMRVKMIDSSSTYMHLYTADQCVVERATREEQGDAKAAATEAELHIHYIKGEKERIIAERREKARLRHKHAREKELLKLDYEETLHELSHLQRADVQRRQQVVSKIPKQIFVPPEHRQADHHNEQENMERAFEDMYLAQTDHMGDLSLALDPHPAPESTTATESLEVSLDGTTMQAEEEVTPKPAPGGTTSQEKKEVTPRAPPLSDVTNVRRLAGGGARQLIDPTKTPDTGLRRLLGRIRAQRDAWTSRTSQTETESSGAEETATGQSSPGSSLTQYSLTSTDLHSNPMTSRTATESISPSDTDSKVAARSDFHSSSEGTTSSLEEGSLTPSGESETKHGNEEVPGEHVLQHPLERAAKLRQRLLPSATTNMSAFLAAEKQKQAAIREETERIKEETERQQKLIDEQRRQLEARVREIEEQKQRLVTQAATPALLNTTAEQSYMRTGSVDPTLIPGPSSMTTVAPGLTSTDFRTVRHVSMTSANPLLTSTVTSALSQRPRIQSRNQLASGNAHMVTFADPAAVEEARPGLVQTMPAAQQAAFNPLGTLTGPQYPLMHDISPGGAREEGILQRQRNRQEARRRLELRAAELFQASRAVLEDPLRVRDPFAELGHFHDVELSGSMEERSPREWDCLRQSALSEMQLDADREKRRPPLEWATASNQCHAGLETDSHQPSHGLIDHEQPSSSHVDFDQPPSSHADFDQPPSSHADFNRPPSSHTDQNKASNSLIDYDQPSVIPRTDQYHSTVIPRADQYHASVSPKTDQCRASVTPRTDQHHSTVGAITDQTQPSSSLRTDQYHSVLPRADQHHSSVIPRTNQYQPSRSPKTDHNQPVSSRTDHYLPAVSPRTDPTLQTVSPRTDEHQHSVKTDPYQPPGHPSTDHSLPAVSPGRDHHQAHGSFIPSQHQLPMPPGTDQGNMVRPEKTLAQASQTSESELQGLLHPWKLSSPSSALHGPANRPTYEDLLAKYRVRHAHSQSPLPSPTPEAPDQGDESELATKVESPWDISRHRDAPLQELTQHTIASSEGVSLPSELYTEQSLQTSGTPSSLSQHEMHDETTTPSVLSQHRLTDDSSNAELVEEYRLLRIADEDGKDMQPMNSLRLPTQGGGSPPGKPPKLPNSTSGAWSLGPLLTPSDAGGVLKLPEHITITQPSCHEESSLLSDQAVDASDEQVNGQQFPDFSSADPEVRYRFPEPGEEREGDEAESYRLSTILEVDTPRSSSAGRLSARSPPGTASPESKTAEGSERSGPPSFRAAEASGITEEPDLTLVSLTSDGSPLNPVDDLDLDPEVKRLASTSPEMNLEAGPAPDTHTGNQSTASLLSFERHEQSLNSETENSPGMAGVTSQSKEATSDTSPTLQEAFQAKKRQFVQRSMQRQAAARSSTAAQQQHAALGKTLASWKKSRTQAPPVAKHEEKSHRDLTTIKEKTSEDRKKAERDMKQRTERLYSQLEEVKQKTKEQDRQQQYADNRQRAKEFQKKHQEQLRKKMQGKKS